MHVGAQVVEDRAAHGPPAGQGYRLHSEEPLRAHPLSLRRFQDQWRHWRHQGDGNIFFL